MLLSILTKEEMLTIWNEDGASEEFIHHEFNQASLLEIASRTSDDQDLKARMMSQYLNVYRATKEKYDLPDVLKWHHDWVDTKL